MNFEEVYKSYLLFAEKQQKKQSFKSFAHNFNSYILPYFKDFDIYELTKQDFISWQHKILDLNFSNNYNRTLHYQFSAFLHYCCDYFNLKSNVAREVGCFKKKYEEKKTDFYSLQEFNKFIRCVDNNIYKQFFNLMFFTGTRPSEAMALKFSDLQGDYISITKSIQRKGNREIDTPKNMSSVRRIKIDKVLKNDLIDLKNYYCGLYGFTEDYFIFGGLKPLSPTSIDRYKKKACERANLRVITQHQFRHSHATLLLQSGIMINEVSKRLGHSRVSTTLDIYTHTDLEQEKRVYNTLCSMRFNFFKSFAHNFKKLSRSIITFFM